MQYQAFVKLDCYITAEWKTKPQLGGKNEGGGCQSTRSAQRKGTMLSHSSSPRSEVATFSFLSEKQSGKGKIKVTFVAIRGSSR